MNTCQHAAHRPTSQLDRRYCNGNNGTEEKSVNNTANDGYKFGKIKKRRDLFFRLFCTCTYIWVEHDTSEECAKRTCDDEGLHADQLEDRPLPEMTKGFE